MARKPQVFSYLRFSTPEQAKGDSRRRQLELSEKWAADHGFKINQTIKDEGVSAFRGKNVSNESGLGHFLKLVEGGTIPPGSILLVESLDRLSRQTVRKALAQFLNLVDHGITIVTLQDGQEFSPGNYDEFKIIMSLMYMMRSHDESRTKSKRLAAAWEGKRLKIDNKKVLTRQLPAWISVNRDGEAVLNEKAKIIKQIFGLAIEGYGQERIAKKINSEHQHIGRKSYIQRSYVNKILNTRAVLGEFCPHKIEYDANNRKRRVPVGKPIADYFPAVVSEGIFFAAKSAIASRRQKRGRIGQHVNLLSGLLFDDTGPYHQSNKGTGRRYVPAAAGHMEGVVEIGIPAHGLDVCVLFVLGMSLDLLKQRPVDDSNEQIAELEAKAEQLQGQISDVQNEVRSGRKALTVLGLLEQLQHDLNSTEQQIDALKSMRASASRGDKVSQAEAASGMVQRLIGGDLEYDDRLDLRNRIRAVVDRIEIRVERFNNLRTVAMCVQMGQFAADYTVILHVKLPNIAMIAQQKDEWDFVPCGTEGKYEQEKAMLVQALQSKIIRQTMLDKTHFTIAGYAEKIGMGKIGRARAIGLGFRTAAECRRRGINPSHFMDETNGHGTCYPEEVLASVFPAKKTS